jgi:hypothetical protein
MSNRDELEKIVSTTFYPRHVSLLDEMDATISRFVVGSYAPQAPPISSDARVACIGSCFAEEMGKSLIRQGRNVATLVLTERWNTAFALRHCIEYALEDRPIPPGFLTKDIALGSGAVGSLKQSGAYIITLGLSICWFSFEGQMILDIDKGHTMGGVIKALTSHTMRQTSVAENVEQLDAIISCIRRNNPTAPIVLTLSPNPLLLSLTDYPPVASNALSKATLRVAIHEITERQLEGVFYWPSYEIVEWVGKNHRILWGQSGNDLRHLESATADDIMARFAKLYFQPA